MGNAIAGKLSISRDKPYPIFQSTPADLQGALFLQFAMAIHGNKNYRKCAVCGKWMELVPPATRITRQTCSNACRQQLYRQRFDRAREMASKGKSPREIAAKLETDLATVKRWLKKK
jgi:hypothetical protein